MYVQHATCARAKGRAHLRPRWTWGARGRCSCLSDAMWLGTLGRIRTVTRAQGTMRDQVRSKNPEVLGAELQLRRSGSTVSERVQWRSKPPILTVSYSPGASERGVMYVQDASTIITRLTRGASQRQSLVQSTQPSGPYLSSSQSLPFLKWPLPKKPRFALKGDGC